MNYSFLAVMSSLAIGLRAASQNKAVRTPLGHARLLSGFESHEGRQVGEGRRLAHVHDHHAASVWFHVWVSIWRGCANHRPK